MSKLNIVEAVVGCRCRCLIMIERALMFSLSNCLCRVYLLFLSITNCDSRQKWRQFEGGLES